MKHIHTINRNHSFFRPEAGCRECPTSCQSACKTSCTVGNQVCRNEAKNSGSKR
ncbi:MAG: six-cysteine peptide SCIFF [Firmicutes bacterium]|nr:six-cysteine peptide SCIFF [Bacillota bacterium]